MEMEVDVLSARRCGSVAARWRWNDMCVVTIDRVASEKCTKYVSVVEDSETSVAGLSGDRNNFLHVVSTSRRPPNARLPPRR